jgi:hypothetical protein
MFESLTFNQLLILSTALTQMIENGTETDTDEGIERNPEAEELLGAAECRMLELTLTHCPSASGETSDT